MIISRQKIITPKIRILLLISINMRVNGKVAVVTGAASGLGFAATKKLLGEGSKVILTDINKEVLETMSDRLSNYSSSQYSTIYHDVSSEESWKEVIDKVELEFNGFNIYLSLTC